MSKENTFDPEEIVARYHQVRSHVYRQVYERHSRHLLDKVGLPNDTALIAETDEEKEQRMEDVLAEVEQVMQEYRGILSIDMLSYLIFHMERSGEIKGWERDALIKMDRALLEFLGSTSNKKGQQNTSQAASA